ncbi:hypothetical protein EES39_40415 [Streptomyces sp. ADI92-24]|uniref:DUF6415 family natural product biosynthesis protein n=1 Tax=Streptomyces sp. ADI92-24 TaxID=1522756 RepID=UPI000F54FC9B|nr:DUF6415 family natural product biosynthesis protein [Streptomyces sp. ADI92-24]RPK29211.1 hypothetical protein EES39_40415 [Streptomyces sp. ADI92-24]
MTAATGLAQRTPLQDAEVEKAELGGDTALLERLVAALKDSVAIDMVALAHLEDDIDAALGERAPAAHQITRLSLRLRSAVAQLVDATMPAVRNVPQGELAAAVLRACEALAESLPAQGDESLGHLRRVALAAQDILDQDVIDEDVLDRAALLAGDEA